jgi:hypothetical protein
MPPKRRFLQKSHGVTSQKTAFFNINVLLSPRSGNDKPNFLSVYAAACPPFRLDVHAFALSENKGSRGMESC